MFSNILGATHRSNHPLKTLNHIKIGGNAKHFVLTHTIDALLDTLHKCHQHSIPYKIIGNGSNILFDDLGFNGTIIKYDNNFKTIQDNILQASSGCTISELIQYTTQQNLGGFEFAIGVPAQLGGAIVNNLGAYSHEICTHIDRITLLKNNQLIYLKSNECEFKYHSSNLQNSDLIVLGATFVLPNQSANITHAKMLEYITKRKKSQPLEYPNLGSVFKREHNIIPAQLIDQAGLKGLTIGDAQVSTKHAGFIVNLGNTTCKNVLKLIKIIKNKIYEKYNIILNLEIEYLPYK